MYELMHGRHSTDNSEIIHYDLTGQLTSIRDNAIIPDLAVMRNMHVGHDQTIAPDFSYPLSGSTSIYSRTLPDGRVITNLDDCLPSLEFKILRNGRNNSPRKNLTIFPDMRSLQDSDIRTNSCSLLNDNILINCHKRLNHHVIRDLSFRMNIS